MSAPMKAHLSADEKTRLAHVFDGLAEEVRQITLERFADIRAPEPSADDLLHMGERG